MKHLLLTVLILPVFAFGQVNVLNAKTPEQIGVMTDEEVDLNNNSPLPYAYVNERDVLFSKTIWEVIDLNERVNFPLFYPSDTTLVRDERRPLIHYLLVNAKNQTIPFVYKKDNLKEKLSLEELNAALKYQKIKKGEGENIGLDRITNEAGTKKAFLVKNNIDLGEYNDIDEAELNDDDYAQFDNDMDRLIFANNLLQPEEYSEENFDYADVIQYKMKGIWYFDKRHAELKYRPIAIAPVVQTARSKSDMKDNPDLKPVTVDLFWIFFPDTRDILHKAEAFNESNTSKPVSFDHLLNSRRFSAYIYKEDNVYQDRSIKDYIPENALMQLLESDRIKEKIRNFEQDMWSY